MKGKIKGEGEGKGRGMEIKEEIDPEGFGGDMMQINTEKFFNSQTFFP